MLRQDAWNWVLRLTSGDATKSDLLDLERWCARSALHAEAFALASGRWRSFGPALEHLACQQPAGEGGATFVLRSSVGRAMARRAFLGGGVAACAAGVAFVAVRPPLGLWPSVTELAADYRTAVGEQRRIALANNGSIDMNTRTSLNLVSDLDGIDRIELISGEAAVATRAKAVAVTAGNVRATANAASFNVRCDGPHISVTCLEGVVELNQHRLAMTLRQDQQITYAADKVGPLVAVQASVVAGWRDGELYFRDQPLSHVVEEVNRYRSGRIFLMNESLGQRRFTARFKLDRLETVVAQLEAIFGARVTKLPGAIIIIS